MSFARPDLIQSFLEEKRRKKNLESSPLLSEDNLASEYEKYNLLKSKNQKKISTRRKKQKVRKDRTPQPISSNNESLNSDTNPDLEKAELTQAQDDTKKGSTNYGGTCIIEENCAEILTAYGSLQATVGQPFEMSLESMQPASYQDYDELKNSIKSKHNFLENEKHISSYHQKHQKGSSSCSFINSPDSQASFGFESDHCHDSCDDKAQKEKKKRQKAMKKLLIATALSFCFMVGEIVGGYLANSLAIMTDASHLLTDVSSFMISIIALKMASRPESKKMTFGWHRAEVIGALISVLAIWIITGVLVYLAVMRLVTNQYRVNGKSMLITAGLAVGFNILMGLVLHEHGHGHSQGHSQGHNHDHESGKNASDSDKDCKESGNVNVRAAFIHVIGDLLQSLGVLAAACIIYFKPEYKIADPICTFLFSVFVLITTITILRDTVVIIMEGSPVNIKYNIVKEKLLEIDEIIAIHDLRLWSLTLNQTVMTAHLVINKFSHPNSVLKMATRRLKSLYDFHSLTLQVEYYCDDMDSCKKCIPA